MKVQHDMSLTGGVPNTLSSLQKLGLTIGVFSLLLLLLAAFNVSLSAFWFYLSIILLFGGIIIYGWASYKDTHDGIKNNGVWFHSLTNRGVLGWLLGLVLTGFYIVLYFYPHLLGLHSEGNTGIIAFFDPLSRLLSGKPASQWFVYGTLYTIAIAAFGIKFIWKYRHNRYEKLRTISVMFFQTAFAFIIPELMARLNSDSFKLPYNDLKNIWPLNYYNFDQYRIDEFISAGTIGIILLCFGIVSIFIITPILTYKFGKRWYCSWVCGCGGLAETVGDPFRQLSDKRQIAWKIERWVVHSVLVFAVVMTTAVIASYLGNDGRYWLSKDMFLIGTGSFLTLLFAWIWFFKKKELQRDAQLGAIGYFIIVISLIALHYSNGITLFLIKAGTLRQWYGFLIGAVFSGVIGTGFYPIFGSRVWCRFGCPMAAILGLQQRLLSKFRITTNGGQCISCGNCSTYCEMGIDVRAYAQKGENIVRASCVGCGICAAVCPRGVLKLENGPLEDRIDAKQVLLGNDVNLLELVNGRK